MTRLLLSRESTDTYLLQITLCYGWLPWTDVCGVLTNNRRYLPCEQAGLDHCSLMSVLWTLWIELGTQYHLLYSYSVRSRGTFLAVCIAMLSIAPAGVNGEFATAWPALISVSTHSATLTQYIIPCRPLVQKKKEPKQGTSPSVYLAVHELDWCCRCQ